MPKCANKYVSEDYEDLSMWYEFLESINIQPCFQIYMLWSLKVFFIIPLIPVVNILYSKPYAAISIVTPY